MTAFARAEETKDSRTVITEIRSYNSRYLDVMLRLPSGYGELEEKIKSWVSKRLQRGRIEISLQIKDASPQQYVFEIDAAKAKAYHDALERLKQAVHIESEISMELLVKLNDLIQPVETEKDLESEWKLVQACLERGVEDLIAMRKKEGDFIAADFFQRLDHIEHCIDQIESQSTGLLTYYQERLRERIASLTKGIAEIDPARVAQEAAFFANRSDISEEIIRARSHVLQFRTIVDASEPAGRKLNFLLQELNREFNTMGAKTEKATVSHIIVDVKTELEKIREQVQNVE
jgi:uncharacterized protein (TIGR00255 family)